MAAGRISQRIGHLEGDGESSFGESSGGRRAATNITEAFNFDTSLQPSGAVPRLAAAPPFLPPGTSLCKLTRASEDPFSPVVWHGPGLILPARPAWEGLKAFSPGGYASLDNIISL